jgi:hypothetical protein
LVTFSSNHDQLVFSQKKKRKRKIMIMIMINLACADCRRCSWIQTTWQTNEWLALSKKKGSEIYAFMGDSQHIESSCICCTSSFFLVCKIIKIEMLYKIDAGFYRSDCKFGLRIVRSYFLLKREEKRIIKLSINKGSKYTISP